MTPRSVAIQGALAFVALILAYTTWQRGPELVAGETFILDVTKNDLEKVRFEDQEGKGSWSELAKGKDNDGTYVTVRMSGYDNTGVGLPSGHPGIPLKLPERLVRGNDSAQRLFDRFSPMRAQRALGVLDPAMSKDLGLDTTKKFLEVTARGIKRRFAIVPAPPGGSDPYVRDLQDNKVYIVNRQILTDMQAASTNLLERKLHNFKVEDMDKMVVIAGDKRREFAASRNDEFPGIRLAPAETPDKPDPTLKNWHDRVFSLFPTEVLGKDEVPKSGPPVLAIRVEYLARGRLLGFADLARGATAATSAPPSADGKTPPAEVYVRSEYTLGWFRVAPESASLLTEAEGFLSKK
ncbi:MAG TPA: hypothetical protein VGG33_14935 [Polyangia bacterium]